MNIHAKLSKEHGDFVLENQRLSRKLCEFRYMDKVVKQQKERNEALQLKVSRYETTTAELFARMVSGEALQVTQKLRTDHVSELIQYAERFKLKEQELENQIVLKVVAEKELGAARTLSKQHAKTIEQCSGSCTRMRLTLARQQAQIEALNTKCTELDPTHDPDEFHRENSKRLCLSD
jgi:uncharacterized coiled-coil protein SlyX